ncbi:MAG: PilZ domain-containing protein, partial [bacterium]|nr:PilZ domain-containing protein [bacterium]
ITYRSGLSLIGETIDISAGGAGVSYSGDLIPRGEKVELSIEDLQLNNKAAEVVWTVSKPDINILGLRWL